MSRLTKMKASNLRAKKDRNMRILNPQAAQEKMALIRLKEWKRQNPARPLYALLDERVAAGDVLLLVLANMHNRAQA